VIREDRDPPLQEGTPMWFSGIDQHKQYCVITTYGPDGPRVKQARVASTPLALGGTLAMPLLGAAAREYDRTEEGISRCEHVLCSGRRSRC